MKRIKILLISLILILGGVFFSNTYAADTERELGAQMKRPFTPAKYKYRVKADNNGNSVVYTVVKIFDNKDKESNNLLYSKSFYCLRGGIGFGASSTIPSEDVFKEAVKYIQSEKSEMHANAKEVIEKYKELYNVDLNRTEIINEKEINIYNAILWILDESYLPKDIKNDKDETIYSAAEYKVELLDKAGVPKSQQQDITDDDLEVIQQLAIWYFANYDDQTSSKNPTVSQATMFPAQFLRINKDNNIEKTRANNLDRIYQYLVYGAINNASTYEVDTETQARTKTIEKNQFDKTSPLTISSVNKPAPGKDIGPESYYKIGPIKIKSNINTRTGNNTVDTNSIVLYDANGSPIDKDYKVLSEDEQPDGTINTSIIEHTIYEFIDAQENPVTSLQKGTEYYIKFKKVFEKGSNIIEDIEEEEQYDVSKVTIKITSSYKLSTATFLYAAEEPKNNQAVVELEKEKIEEGDEITTEVFDLSLRKFITAINGKELTGEDSRIPRIDLSKLNTTDTRTGEKITTATYTHPKNKLIVETGNKVIYTIRVYNEGELDGTATEITDYLPTGLKLVPASESEINTTYGWKNPSGDERTITTDYLKNTTIRAFDPSKTSEEEGWQKAETGNSGLYYADVKVECEVVAQVGSQDQSLRNIAAITADTGDDRDSVPGDPGRDNYDPPIDNSTYKEDDDDYENLILKAKNFDLSLRKFITKIERVNKETQEKEELDIASREPVIEIKGLKDGTSDTARYIHPKNKISLKRGDIIYYTIRVYNEGDLDGYATEVKDYLPEGLELVDGENEIWTKDGNTISTDYLKDKKLLGYDRELKEASEGINWQKASDDETGLYYYDLTVVCKIKDDVQDGATLTNIAEITSDKSEPTDIDDRDSQPANFPEDNKNNNYEGNGEENGYFPGKQDDDDFERVTVEPDEIFDLALRKYISSIKRNGAEVEFDDRTPKINTETLIKGTFDRNGNLEYTATYEHSKEPLVVKKGDIITYTLRVYNEGEKDGHATEITDYIPEGLALIKDYKTNFDNKWKLPDDLNSDNVMNLVGEKGFYKTEEEVKNFKLEDFSDTTSLKDVQLITGKVAIKTSELDDELIKAFDKNKTEVEDGWQKAETGDGGLYYKDVQVSCLVIAENTYKGTITNIAEISADDGDDRDSTPNNKKDPYDKWQEDDDDYEPVVLKYFDLALRKFITGVETNGKTEDITSRNPNLSIDEETGNIKYTHPKEEAPVAVANNDVVIYTLRVYNEGTLAGYAEEITDDIPEGLVYLPDHDVNKQYEWKMFDKDGNLTDKLDEAQTIKTEYLSEEKEKTENRDNLIDPFDSSKPISTEEPFNPDYKDVKVAFRVIEPNTSDRVIINSAQISKDSGDDEDSVPGEWNEGEDDQDREYVYVKYFDLSLLKWVTKTIVTVDGKTTTTETGFKPNTGKTETTGIRDNKEQEPIAKVELDKKKLSKTTVKFAYKIRVTNEGEIAGYATEITDFIPKGLEFKAEDNKAFGWVKEGENKVTTRALETVLLQPGESAEVEIIFTWKRDTNNLGLKTNIAEITEDYNENGSKDIDSTPDNKKDPYEKEQEDDDDFALVILSIKTGKGVTYTLLITTVVTIFAAGIYLIKKYVLTY